MSKPPDRFDASDPDAIARRGQDLKGRRQLMAEAFKQFANSKGGRMWLWETLEVAGIYQTCVSTDPMAMALYNGQRNLGLKIMADLESYAPGAEPEMKRENRKQAQPPPPPLPVDPDEAQE